MRLAQFFDAMMTELENNSHKDGWSSCTQGYLLHRLLQETEELREALVSEAPLADVLSEAADVANFCFMLADNYQNECYEREDRTQED